MPALVNPSTPPLPGQVSLLIDTVPPSGVVYSGSSVTPSARSRAIVARSLCTCQPKCHTAVCGCVAGGCSTFVNSTSTLFGDFNAGTPPHVDFDVLGNS